MTDEECKAIEAECLKNVREAIKTITSGDIYDRKGYLNEKGYKALEELEGLDLFWVCDPSIKLVNKGGEWKVIHNALEETKYQCNQCQHYIKSSDDKNFCPNCGAKMKGGC